VHIAERQRDPAHKIGSRRLIVVKTEDEWAEDVKRLLRAEMTRRGITYDGLIEKLAAIGIGDTAVNLRNKVSRGRFSASFLVQCLVALGVHTLRLSEDADNK